VRLHKVLFNFIVLLFPNAYLFVDLSPEIYGFLLLNSFVFSLHIGEMALKLYFLSLVYLLLYFDLHLRGHSVLGECTHLSVFRLLLEAIWTLASRRFAFHSTVVGLIYLVVVKLKMNTTVFLLLFRCKG